MAEPGQRVMVDGVVKRYRGRTALNWVSFELGVGVTGLLGPNGAGKTTLLRCLATVLERDEGSVRIFGHDPDDRAGQQEIRARLGYLPQNPGTYPSFTAEELVEYFAVLKQITDRAQRRVEVRRVLAEVELTDRATSKIRKLSGGMRQRLALACALLGAPELLILDEPTVGMDPEQRRKFRALISDLGERAVVLLSTHQTEDVAMLCEQVIVINRGRVIFSGTPLDLAAVAAGRVWETAEKPDSGIFWRTAEGRYRGVGTPRADAVTVTPTVEDGYTLLLSEQDEGALK